MVPTGYQPIEVPKSVSGNAIDSKPEELALLAQQDPTGDSAMSSALVAGNHCQDASSAVADLPVAETSPPPSGAALRMRRSRELRRKGLRSIPFPVRDSEIENLIKLNILDPTLREDRKAIARALGALMDRIPVSWWQAAIQLRSGK